jgi:hypothetical protein
MYIAEILGAWLIAGVLVIATLNAAKAIVIARSRR